MPKSAGRRLTALLAVGLVAGLALAPAVEAKKRKGGGNVDITQRVAATIPDGSANFGGPDGVLVSTIEVGKKFRGRRVRDVNVTVHTTGSPATDYALDFFDLRFILSAPNGATTTLFDWISGGTIGPLTLDDESQMTLGGSLTPSNPFELVEPFVGTARGGVLAAMDNGPVKGRWSLIVLDLLANPAATSTLESWRLQVVAGRPYATK